MNIQEQTEQAVKACNVAYATHKPSDACFAFIGLCESGNKYLELTKPWKSKDPKPIYEVLECLRIVAILIYPVMPQTAHEVWDQLNWKTELSGKEQRFRWADTAWGAMPVGHQVGQPHILFPKIITTAKAIRSHLG
jgi:methionyl-tRNA synthetase